MFFISRNELFFGMFFSIYLPKLTVFSEIGNNLMRALGRKNTLIKNREKNIMAQFGNAYTFKTIDGYISIIHSMTVAIALLTALRVICL